MSTLTAYKGKSGSAEMCAVTHLPLTVNLCTAKATDGVTDNILDRGGDVSGPVLLRFSSTGTGGAGAGTQTFLIEGSPDGTNWFPASHSATATPDTYAVTTFADAVANTDVVWYIVKATLPYRFLRVTISLTTTRNATIDAFIY